MHDTLLYLSKEPIHRQYHHNQMTFSMVYAWSENYVLPISHDEVVHGKRLAGRRRCPATCGSGWPTCARCSRSCGRTPASSCCSWAASSATTQEWNEERGLNWALPHDPLRAGVQQLVRDLNAVYRGAPALWSQDTTPAGFRWIVATTPPTTRWRSCGWRSDGSPLVCVVNFAAVPHENYRIGLPRAGAWTEVLNTDAGDYGGSGVGNLGVVRPRRCPGTACRPRRGCGCRRWARSGCAPPRRLKGPFYRFPRYKGPLTPTS